jgi:hypothetical protein
MVPTYRRYVKLANVSKGTYLTTSRSYLRSLTLDLPYERKFLFRRYIHKHVVKYRQLIRQALWESGDRLFRKKGLKTLNSLARKRYFSRFIILRRYNLQ